MKWKTKDGRVIPLSELTDSHLLSIERMLVGRGAKDYKNRENLFIEHYDAIRDEIEARGLECLEDHISAAVRNENMRKAAWNTERFAKIAETGI